VSGRFRAAMNFAAILLVVLIEASCGDYYRPVAFPILPTPPNPALTHIAVVITGNGINNPGASTTIDVSGDSAVSQSSVGIMPAHALLAGGGTSVFVANRADDSLSLFSPSIATPVITLSLPAGSAPAFLASTEIATVYVANSGNNTVSAISTANNVLANTVLVGGSPVAMAEMPNGQKLYVAMVAANGGTASVASINSIDKSVNAPVAPSATAPWTSPAWVVSRSDGQRIYVLDKGSGFVSAIDTYGDIVVGAATVGVGADYMAYEPTLNRLYVTNPVTGVLTSLDTSNDNLTAMTATVANAISVAPLPDGTRVYVASATVSGAAPNQTVASSVTVLNTSNLSVKSKVPLTSTKLSCASMTWSQLSIAAAADSSRVYVGNCDAGQTSVIQTSNDSLLLNIPAPLGAFAPPQTSAPPQNPVFVLTGP